MDGRTRSVTFLQLAKHSPWLGPSFPGQGENGKSYMTSAEDPVVHFSPKGRGWVWVESVNAMTYVVHKMFPDGISLSLILRTWKIYRLGLKAETERRDPLWPHCTSVLSMRPQACLIGNNEMGWSSWSVWSESFCFHMAHVRPGATISPLAIFHPEFRIGWIHIG